MSDLFSVHLPSLLSLAFTGFPTLCSLCFRPDATRTRLPAFWRRRRKMRSDVGETKPLSARVPVKMAVDSR